MTKQEAREIFEKNQKFYSSERLKAVELSVSLMSDTVDNTTTLILSGNGEGSSNVYLDVPYMEPCNIPFEPWSVCAGNLPYRRNVHHYAGHDILQLIDSRTVKVRF